MTDELVEKVARAMRAGNAPESGIFGAVTWGDYTKMARSALAAVEASGFVLVPKCDPFRNADEKDWEHLFKMLPNSGHGKFWKAVLMEVKTEISARHKQEDAG